MPPEPCACGWPTARAAVGRQTEPGPGPKPKRFGPLGPHSTHSSPLPPPTKQGPAGSRPAPPHPGQVAALRQQAMHGRGAGHLVQQQQLRGFETQRAQRVPQARHDQRVLQRRPGSGSHRPQRCGGDVLGFHPVRQGLCALEGQGQARLPRRRTKRRVGAGAQCAACDRTSTPHGLQLFWGTDWRQAAPNPLPQRTHLPWRWQAGAAAAGAWPAAAAPSCAPPPAAARRGAPAPARRRGGRGAGARCPAPSPPTARPRAAGRGACTTARSPGSAAAGPACAPRSWPPRRRGPRHEPRQTSGKTRCRRDRCLVRW